MDHYIAIDWAKATMAIARLTAKSDKPHIVEQASDVNEVKFYLKRLSGTKILAIEECNWSQWLYTELKPFVDEVVVCDPYRNKLLNEGSKTDKIDAHKLCKLLRAGLLKPVFHTSDEFIYLRKIVSAHDDLVSAGHRIKNQRNALFRARGKNAKQRGETLDHEHDRFVLEGLDVAIAQHKVQKTRYLELFDELVKKHKMIRNIETIPGIGRINSVKLAAVVVDPKRFESKGNFLSYCGLIKLERSSGGKCLGKKFPRCNKLLKAVFKTATAVAILQENFFFEYYEYLIKQKNYSPHNARNAVARRIAVLALGVMKSGKKFNYRSQKCSAA